MFTFGREHERKCAVAYVRNPVQAALIIQVVDSVHDLLEGKEQPDMLARAIRAAFVEGGAGIWEQAGSWLRKSSSEYPQLNELWLELAKNEASNVRFRVACSLDDMSESVREQVAPLLLADKNKKVATMARERMTPLPKDPSASHAA